MKKIKHLKTEALDDCRFRGHDMEPFFDHMNFAAAACRKCKMGVIINADPMPNRPAIFGEAVAMSCEKR